MGNCFSNRPRYQSSLPKNDRISLELTYTRYCSSTPRSRKEGFLNEECLELAFKENPRLGQQIYWYMWQHQNDTEGVRYDSFLQISELLLSESCLHLLLTMIATFRESQRVTEEINYIAALESITTFQRMVLRKSRIDELPAKSLLDTIFDTNIDKFSDRLRLLMPGIDQHLQNYFADKLLGSERKSRIPYLRHPSYILNPEYLSLMTSLFNGTQLQQADRLSLLYSSMVHERSIECICRLLEQCQDPTIVVIETDDGSRFGGLTNIRWSADGAGGGTKDDILFTLSPQMRVLQSKQDKFTRQQYTYVNYKNQDLRKGVGFGGELSKDFRIFVEDLENVQLKENDKSFANGHLAKSQRMKVFEIWSLEKVIIQQNLHLINIDQLEDPQYEDYDNHPQVHLDEDLSSFHSGQASSIRVPPMDQQAEDDKWGKSQSDDTENEFEEVILQDENGNDIVPQRKSNNQKVQKEVFQASCVDSDQVEHQELNGFIDEVISEQVVMQASNYQQAQQVISGVFGNQSEHDEENVALVKSSRFGGSSRLEVIHEDLKESYHTQN